MHFVSTQVMEYLKKYPDASTKYVANIFGVCQATVRKIKKIIISM